MEIKQIKEMMAAMERTGVTKIHLKGKNDEILLERENTKVVHINHPPFAVDHSSMLPVSNAQAFLRDATLHHPQPSEAAKGSAAPEAAVAAEASKGGRYITSPMVGTFYLKPAPDANDFVKVGDILNAESVVCIIEAMKVMNEVKAGESGTVAEVLVQNGQPVEFGMKLFRLN